MHPWRLTGRLFDAFDNVRAGLKDGPETLGVERRGGHGSKRRSSSSPRFRMKWFEGDGSHAMSRSGRLGQAEARLIDKATIRLVIIN